MASVGEHAIITKMREAFKGQKENSEELSENDQQTKEKLQLLKELIDRIEADTLLSSSRVRTPKRNTKRFKEWCDRWDVVKAKWLSGRESYQSINRPLA
jgi:septation ring formation regulator EzrA